MKVEDKFLKKTKIFIVVSIIFVCITSTAYSSTNSNVLERCNFNRDLCMKINELYKFINYEKIWNQKRLEEFEYLIHQSKYEGLNHEYYLRSLKQYKADQQEIKLTSLLIKIAYHTYYGMLSPSKIFKQWNIPKKEDRVIKSLATLIKEDRIRDLFKELSPKHEGFVQLRQELRKLIALEGKDNNEKIQIKEKLQLGSHNSQISLIKRKIKLLGFYEDSDESPYFDEKLKNAIEEFQRRHNLEVDGILGKNTLRAINVSISEKISQVKLNLEKYRWLPETLGEKYIFVNIPSFELKLIDKNKIILTSSIIVGKNYIKDFRPTPILFSKITNIVINPDWYIPQKIAVKDILPRIKKNPNYAIKDKIRIYMGEEEIDPREVDWSQYSENNFPFRLIQLSSNKNALGRIKFYMPNNFDIYLHDTPHKQLFNQKKRTFSSGCIRVEKAYELAVNLIHNNNQQNWNEQKLKEALTTDKTYIINLKNSIPVYILYFTNTVENSQLFFYEDIYGYDMAIKKILSKY